MWYFDSPKIVFGEGALGHLGEIEGHRAFIVSDGNLATLGFVDRVADHLARAGLESERFLEVE
ncbi:MAG TPA: iron-containing alcohol dehydrogenase, partial [Chloroflexi bacterium]|nr:iron-containing alcohol dehydrogenase [Chloroflexota bacterium]